MRLRRAPVLLLALALAGGAAAAPPEPDAASERALRDFTKATATLGYVYGAPLLELAIAEYRQTHGLARELSGSRGALVHAAGGALATHDTTWLPFPEPDVLYSSAWLDLAAQPYVLWIPPMDGIWYGVQLQDAFTNDVGSLSARTIGSVGGWYLIAHESWGGERPPGVMDEVRVPTSLAWLLLRIAATPENAAARHARYQAGFKLLPLAIYQRNPKAAAFAPQQPLPSPKGQLRASLESRGTLDAFRIIQQRLRESGPRRGEEALLALFDRAGFGPNATLDLARLPKPQLDGLRSAAHAAERMLEELRRTPETTRSGWSALPSALGAYGDDYLLRATQRLGTPLPVEIAQFEAVFDRDGRALDGRNDYVIRFREDALPPGDGFWSIAAYAAETGQLLDTRTSRYSVGAAPERLERAPDGSLEIRLSSTPPETPAQEANWLPVRSGPLRLVARIYQPLPAVLEARYSLPSVVPAEP